jgi:PAS domain S-box-containing protein
MEEKGVTVPWTPVIAVDIIGSMLTLAIAIVCAGCAWDWNRKKADDIFRDYIFLLTLAFVFFAVSRSFGHLVKQFLIYYDMTPVWKDISPFSGAVSTAAFIVIFAFGLYFQRFQKIHGELEDYKDNLEELVEKRTNELELANRSLKEENTQRRKAEERLRQTSATLENIFNSTSPICITGIDYELMETNEAYRRIWAAPRKDGKPLKCYESRPGKFCHTADCPLEKILQGHEQTICEVPRILPDGTEKIFLQTTKPFRDADGNLAGTVTSFQEITERRRAQDALAAERERLAVTLRSIGDGVITTDIEGRVVMLNKEAEKLCGWKQEEAAGKVLKDVFCITTGEEQGGQCENPVERVLSTGKIMTLPDRTILLSRDGTRRNIADSGAPIRDAESRIIGVVLVFRDVTDRLRMERELQKTQKLESVGILAGGIAHDFNNILAAILGNIDLAIHRLGGKDEKITPLLLDAEKASLRAKGLTQQLLTFARGGSPIRRTVSLEGIIKDSAVFVLRGSNVRCDVQVPEDLWLVEVDPGQMSQVVQNMILNAREVMKEGGTVTISARNYEGRVEELHTTLTRWVEMTIADKGPGMTTAVSEHLFDPYFTTKEKGSGLGLSICHSIISQHKGTIRVASTPGAGTTFTILLPAGSGKGAAQEEQKKEPVVSRKGARILVMDDEEMVRNIASEMLVHLGLAPELVHEGKQAVASYQEAMDQGRKFDLVIMDLTIPGGMGGKDAVREILQLDQNARVIVSSGYSNDPVMSAFETYGFCAAVIKPFQLQELAEAVNTALSTG